MIRLTVKLLLLSWAVAAKRRNEFEEPEDARSVPPKNKIVKFPPSETSQSNHDNESQQLLRQLEVNAITSEATERAHQTKIPNPAVALRSVQDVSQRLREDTALLFEKVEACRESHPGMSNQTDDLQLYGSLFGSLVGVENESFKSALRRCNISEELVDKLKAKLSQLEIFQDIFVLVPRNNSSESPEHGKSTQQPTPPASGIYSQRFIQTTGVENNLKLKLGDEWIPLEPKVSHVSHIYLGSSIYPILTEESRVLDKEHTIPNPIPTEESPTETQQRLEWMKDIVSALQTAPKQKMFQLELSPRQQGNKSEAPPRLSRSLRKKNWKYSESNLAATENFYLSPGTDAPQRLNLLPKNSYNWEKSGNDKYKMETKRPLDLKALREDPRYRMVQKFCSAILQHFRKFIKAEVLKQRVNDND